VLANHNENPLKKSLFMIITLISRWYCIYIFEGWAFFFDSHIRPTDHRVQIRNLAVYCRTCTAPPVAYWLRGTAFLCARVRNDSALTCDAAVPSAGGKTHRRRNQGNVELHGSPWGPLSFPWASVANPTGAIDVRSPRVRSFCFPAERYQHGKLLRWYWNWCRLIKDPEM
jgi:hypothetical protein